MRSKYASLSGAALTAMLFVAPVHAQETAAEYPSRPITFVVPFGAGGSSDIMARTLAPLLEEKLGGTVNVENRPGATATLGTTYVANAKPDGYTIMVNPVGIFTLQPLLRPVQYSIQDFKGLSGLSVQEIILVVKADAPWNSVQELISDLKSSGREIVYGSSGNAGFPHISQAATLQAAGVSGRHVAFQQGSAEAIASLLGGHIEMIAEHPPAVLPLIRDGSLKPLAVMSAERLESLPEVPTISEAGIHVGPFAVWNSALTQDDVPADIVAELEEAFQWALTQPGWTEAAARLNFEIYAISGDEVDEQLAKETDLYGGLMDSLGLRQN